ncbi:MAG: kynureninase [Pseudomonadota bacterium]
MDMLPKKECFLLPEGTIYLDGNSLGPLAKGVEERVRDTVVEEWGGDLIKAWNSHDWMAKPLTLADKIGRLIGAPPSTTVLGDTLSIKVYQAVAAAIKLRPDRKVILSDSGNFPSDLYMAQGLIQTLDQGHELRVVAPDAVADAIDEDCAAIMLTHVDYRTGRMHDMRTITELAHAAGAVMIWDLAHSAGAVPFDAAACGCEFAVGCTYKYLNSGPGGPAFIYCRPDLLPEVSLALEGWLGHDAPFAFEPTYRRARSIECFRVGSPPILQIAALEAAMEVWEGVDMAEIRAASLALANRFIAEVDARIPALTLVSPREDAMRGSQVSFAFEQGYAAMQALIDRGVIGDFRAPDIMRFGLTPLYIDEADVLRAVDILEEVINGRLWDQSQYKRVNRVT